MNYEELHRSQSELEGADAELVTKMRECYSFLRSIEQAKINRMFFLTDTTKEERFFWATLNDIASYQRPWVEELKERNKRNKGMNYLNELLEEAKSVVGPGWWPIIDKYLPQMFELAPEGEFFFKEKYGTLRMEVYGQGLDHKKLTELEIASEQASETVCEECGTPGRLRNDRSWMQTLCETCYQKALIKEKSYDD